jgi:hypothetical protein
MLVGCSVAAFGGVGHWMVNNGRSDSARGVIRTAGMDFKMGMIWIDSSLARYPNTHDISRSGFIRQTQGRRSCSRVIRM